MNNLEPGWHLKVETGMELMAKQDLMGWKQSGESFCNLPLYEQKQYCKECWRIGDEAAKKIEMEEKAISIDQPKSVSDRVLEWHQKQLKLK